MLWPCGRVGAWQGWGLRWFLWWWLYRLCRAWWNMGLGGGGGGLGSLCFGGGGGPSGRGEGGGSRTGFCGGLVGGGAPGGSSVCYNAQGSTWALFLQRPRNHTRNRKLDSCSLVFWSTEQSQSILGMSSLTHSLGTSQLSCGGPVGHVGSSGGEGCWAVRVGKTRPAGGGGV